MGSRGNLNAQLSVPEQVVEPSSLSPEARVRLRGLVDDNLALWRSLRRLGGTRTRHR